MNIALLCIALLAFLCIATGMTVTVARGKMNRMFGAGEVADDPFYKLVRAHGNTIEYAPILAVLMLALAQSPQAQWVYVCMGLATACRYLIVWGIAGFGSLNTPNPARFIGALGTYIFGLGLCVALLLQAI